MTTLDCTEAYGVIEDFSLRGTLRLSPYDNQLPFDEFTRGEIQPVEPVRFRPSGRGKKATHFVGTTLATLNVVSEAFVDTLRSHAFTGWSTFPVVVSSKGEELNGYVGFAVTGRCGPLDRSLSQQVLLEPLGPGLKPSAGLRGKCWDPASWDGSDFFTPHKTAWICVRPSVRQALLKAGTATGCEFELMSEVTTIVEGWV